MHALPGQQAYTVWAVTAGDMQTDLSFPSKVRPRSPIVLRTYTLRSDRPSCQIRTMVLQVKLRAKHFRLDPTIDYRGSWVCSPPFPNKAMTVATAKVGKKLSAQPTS